MDRTDERENMTKPQTMNTRQRELIRFALSYLMANRLDAFEDVVATATPTLEELEELYTLHDGFLTGFFREYP